MLGPNSRLPAAIALVGALLGLLFASYSSLDYAEHLDRRLHDVHCSFIPGASATSEAEACRAAMYSPYSALLKDDYWGGIPISLFALGAFTFFAGFAVYLLIATSRAPRQAVTFFAATSVTPLLISLVMLVISLTKLGGLCKTCVGIYIASFVLAVGGLLCLSTLRARHPAAPGAARPAGGALLPLAWIIGLGVVTLVPAVVYASSVPNHEGYISKCGALPKPPTEHIGLLKLRTSRSRQQVLLFEDPLCPTCKAFHERLVAEDIFDKLDVQLAMFPLDNTCNWMLDTALHPGACLVSKAVICAGEQARQVLEWAYEEQPYLTRAGKQGEGTLRAVIQQRWGDAILKCTDDRQTGVTLNQHLHFASENNVPVSTPQMYLGKQRVCDEDTDIGLRFTLARLAPEVLR
jgi:uncharacterized membrane protein